MQRGLLIVVVALSILLFSSCERAPSDSASRYIAVDFPSYDALRAVLGSDKEISYLLPPGVDVHDYEPSPRDGARVQDADLVVYNGGEGERWVRNILSSAGQSNFLSLMYLVGISEDEDEHVYTSPVLYMRIIDALSEAIGEIEPERREEIHQNAAIYNEKIKALDDEIRAIVSDARVRRLLFASRYPLVHFSDTYSLSFHAPFDGSDEESEVSAIRLVELIDLIRAEGAKYFLVTEAGPSALSRVVEEETEAKPLLFHSFHSLTAEERDAGVTWLSLMENNVSSLREALS